MHLQAVYDSVAADNEKPILAIQLSEDSVASNTLQAATSQIKRYHSLRVCDWKKPHIVCMVAEHQILVVAGQNSRAVQATGVFDPSKRIKGARANGRCVQTI